MLAEHEMFEQSGGGETSEQGQAVEAISCQANNVGQYRQAFTFTIRSVIHTNQWTKFGMLLVIVITKILFNKKIKYRANY